MIEIGDKVRDVVTGYEGIVLAKTSWLYNSDRIAIQRQTLINDITYEESIWIDVSPRIEILEKGIFKSIVVEPKVHSFNELDHVEDTITGIRGLITGFSTWYSGCVRAICHNQKA